MPPPTFNSPRGQITTVPIADPGVGQTFGIVVPARRRLIIRTIRFTLVASIPGGGRLPTVLITDGDNIPFKSCPASTLPPGSGAEFVGADYGWMPGVAGAVVPFLLPPIPMVEGFTFSLEIDGIEADDQISGISFIAESWIEPVFGV